MEDAPGADAAVAGVRWFAGVRVAVEVVSLAAAVTLAHLVPPADFGRAAIALVLPMLALILAFEGFGTPLVQRRAITRQHEQSAALMSLGCGFALGVAVFLLAPVVAEPLFDARAAGLLQLMSPVFPIAAAGVVSMALLQRRLAFGRLATAELATLCVTAAVSVSLAAAGLDAHAIVIGALAGSVGSTLALILSAPPPAPWLHRSAAGEIVRFGAASALSGLVYTLRRNVAYLVLGARAGPVEVGLYWRAFQLGGEYQAKVSGILLRVLFPLLARAPDAAASRALRRRATRVHALLVFPLLGLFVVVAPEAVPFVFGDEWRAAVRPAQVLALAGMALALLSGTEATVLAAGRPGALLAYSLGFLMLYGAATWIAAPHGLVALAAGAVVVHLVVLVVAQHVLLRRVVDARLGELLRDVAPATFATVVLLAVALPSAAALRETGVPGAMVVATALAAGGLAYLATLRVASPAAWAELALLTARFTGRGAAPSGQA